MPYSTADFHLIQRSVAFLPPGSLPLATKPHRRRLQRLLKPFLFLNFPPQFFKFITPHITSNTTAHLSFDSVLLFNRPSKQVHRIAFDRLGNINVLNNYNFINSTVLDCPKPISLDRSSPLKLSIESYIFGRPVTSDYVDLHLVHRIIDQLSPHYQQHALTAPQSKLNDFDQYRSYTNGLSPRWRSLTAQLQRDLFSRTVRSDQVRLFRTLIHGDLTHDNLLLNGMDSISFLDFGRSTISYPEIDLLTFNAYYLTHASNPVNYHQLFKHLSSPINRQARIWLNYLYQRCPPAKINARHLQFIQSILVYRLFVLTLTNLPPHDPSPAQLYSIIKQGFKL